MGEGEEGNKSVKGICNLLGGRGGSGWERFRDIRERFDEGSE